MHPSINCLVFRDCFVAVNECHHTSRPGVWPLSGEPSHASAFVAGFGSRFSLCFSPLVLATCAACTAALVVVPATGCWTDAECAVDPDGTLGCSKDFPRTGSPSLADICMSGRLFDLSCPRSGVCDRLSPSFSFLSCSLFLSQDMGPLRSRSESENTVSDVVEC